MTSPWNQSISGGVVPMAATLGIVLGIVLGFVGGVSTSHAGGFEDAIDAAVNRVVKLYGLGAGRQKGYGTGVLISADGRVLTVSSLLIDSRFVRAVAADGSRYRARVEHRDSRRELALLQLVSTQSRRQSDGEQPVGPFPFFDLNDDPELSPGDWVLSAGNAFKIAHGAEPVSVNHGVFSTLVKMDARRGVQEFPYHGDILIIDAITSNPGAPGSAVVNIDGRLVGMIGRGVTSNLTHTHLNYAMPLAVLREFVAEADRASEAGAAVAPNPKADQGNHQAPTDWDPGIRIVRTGYQKLLPFVDRVKRGSAADVAGIRRDDLILSINGQSVPDADAFDKRMKAVLPAGEADIVLRRGRAIKQIHLQRAGAR